MAYSLEEFFERQAAWQLEGEAWRLAGQRTHTVLVPRGCGHEEAVELPLAVYPKSIDRVMEPRCRTCQAEIAAIHAEDDADVARRADEMGLPELVGSDKQVAWAMKLRDYAIARHGFEHVERALLVRTEAAWWISNRDGLHDIRVLERAEQADHVEE